MQYIVYESHNCPICFGIPHEHTYLSASHIINSQAISCTTNQQTSFSNLIFCNYFIHLITSLAI